MDDYWLSYPVRALGPGDDPPIIWGNLPQHWIWLDLLPWPMSRTNDFVFDIHKFIALPLSAIIPQMVIKKWPDDNIFWALTRIFNWRRASRKARNPKYLSQQNRLTPRELVQSSRWDKAWDELQQCYTFDRDVPTYDVIDTFGALVKEDQGRFSGWIQRELPVTDFAFLEWSRRFLQMDDEELSDRNIN